MGSESEGARRKLIDVGGKERIKTSSQDFRVDDLRLQKSEIRYEGRACIQLLRIIKQVRATADQAVRGVDKVERNDSLMAIMSLLLSWLKYGLRSLSTSMITEFTRAEHLRFAIFTCFDRIV